MKKLFRNIICSVALGVLSTSTVFGVPAKPQVLSFQQPDGTQVALTQKGDEKFHYFQTSDGYIVAQDADGWYRIVDNDGTLTSLKPEDSQQKARVLNSELAKINPKLAFESLRQETINARAARVKSSKAAPQKAVSASKWDNSDGHDLRDFPCEGEQNVLVILVNFSDKSWSFNKDPQKEMSRILNEPGYKDNGFDGSAYDYFQKSSGGVFKPKFDVYGPVTLSKGVSYYGSNDKYGEDKYPNEMVIEACKLLDSTVDFSKYDRNGDGFVDNVYVFYAGYGESDGGGSSTIWPHSFELKYTGTCPTLDGVTLNKYACSNELNYYRDSSVKEMSGIGTFCHEFSHVLGLPDIYATDYADSFTPGDYTIMDLGSYNGDGRTPPVYSIYERYALEWQKPIDITDANEINMLPMSRDGLAYKITIDPSDPTEYYLFENRQQEGWDSYIPGHGMLIWHIDFDASIWAQNIVNNTPSHQYLDLIEADNKQTESSVAADPFPGTGKITSFTGTTTPAFKNWSGKKSTLPITDIAETDGGILTFKVNGGGNESSSLYCGKPEIRLLDQGSESVTLEWDKVKEAESYILTVSTTRRDQYDNLVFESLPDYSFRNIGNVTKYEVSGLEPEKNYTISLLAQSAKNIAFSDDIVASTIAADFGSVVPQLQLGEVTDHSAELSWPGVSGAEHYLVTVAQREIVSSGEVENVDFTNKDYPDEWMFSATWETRADYCGQAVPAIKFTMQDSEIETPRYDKDIESISFWARVQREDATLSLKVYSVSENDNVTFLREITEIDGTSQGSNIVIDNLPDGVTKILMRYSFTSQGLALNIDDIVVRLCGESVDTPIAGYDGLHVDGNGVSVSNLDASTPYIAYICAHNGDKLSAKSNVVKFTTKQSSGVAIESTDRNDGFTIANGVITASDGEMFSVYTADGKVLVRNVSGSYRLTGKGIYIIRSKNKVSKVCL